MSLIRETKKKPAVLAEGRKEDRPNAWRGDRTLQAILRERLDPELFAYAEKELDRFGDRVLNEIDERARHTDRDGQPKLIPFDRYGEEISEVWVNEGYRQTVKETYGEGIVGYVHKEILELGRKGNYTYSFAQGYLLSEAEPGFYCPVTLSMATAYLLDHYADDALKARFLPHVCSTGETELYEGATFLTERQGGSDVGANLVRAVKEGDRYWIYGEKYFASNAGMAGVAMVLARIEGAGAGPRGLSLFAVPWKKEDGSLNGLRVRRLKDKLGVRAVPSGEVEFDGAEAFVVGDPAKGFYYMMEALNLSRICNAVASVGIMRRALDEAHDYAARRNAFGRRLTDYPMVRDTLGKMSAKLNAELLSVFDLIDLYQKVADGKATEREQVLNRLYIALLKKETAEEAIRFTHEAIEMHGGNGYIEDFVTPRLLRDAQVLTVWEGTANILGLELQRLVKKYAAHELFIEEMNARIGGISGAAKETVEHVMDSLSADLMTFAGLDDPLQTYEAKGLAKRMAHVYEGVVALEWAEREGGRFRTLADVYIEETWNTRVFGGPMKTVDQFDELMG
ncbi:acyl-CoA dehydrogenase family protein [Bhargavaea cecembensis]|uniref:acyl-CoA dehydrogenase family protein n=1 Tax=Bhargavaea cecembensis TaxID=394098 RepID=UPI0009E48454|nr:acyl-CoA dehydrogenase family protein [Bhargavaea cecembensis]